VRYLHFTFVILHLSLGREPNSCVIGKADLGNARSDTTRRTVGSIICPAASARPPPNTINMLAGTGRL
jgi:hypothetical protein